jgi:AGZA family xanthine/uracil permease-like MFS transporter
MMPFAYSITEGIVYGILTYVILKLVSGKLKNINVVTVVLFIIFAIRFCLK